MAQLFADVQTSITPEIIKGKLFSFHAIAHSLHLDTKSFEQHNALNTLYEELEEFKDEIVEKLMGYNMGRRIGQIKIDPIPVYTPEAPLNLCKEILVFSKQLADYGRSNQFIDIENKAQEMSGLAAQTVYRLSLT